MSNPARGNVHLLNSAAKKYSKKKLFFELNVCFIEIFAIFVPLNKSNTNTNTHIPTLFFESHIVKCGFFLCFFTLFLCRFYLTIR